ncbi:MAG: acyl-CoA thioesterase [Rickettsiales bacterium]|nr:acyl-CoA thioesterase [Rickettsiales bacterium]
MTQLVLPGDTNSLGTAFGGRIMAWLDIAAGISAGRHSAGPVVTASVDDLHFFMPIQKGDVVVLKAQVNYVGTTAMEVGVRVEGERWGGERYHALTAYTTFVALDDERRPRPVRGLLLETDEDRRRASDAAERVAERRRRRGERSAKFHR